MNLTIRTYVYILAIVSVSLSPLFAQIEYRTDWPRIRDLKTSITVNTSEERIDQSFSIHGTKGDVLYTLSCKGGTTDYLDSLSNASGSNYVGVMCFFLTVHDSTHQTTAGDDWNLLCEDGTASWYSRGQIHEYAELQGSCGKYPEYGNLRHFRLRGFVLTIRFTPITTGRRAQLSSIKVEITTHSDSTITSSIAEQSGYLPPDPSAGGCAKVLRGKHASMWRDKEGNWIELK